jgi:putative phosphoribosyl transferase
MKRSMPMEIYSARPYFSDRKDAGRRLANELSAYRNKDVVVFAIPRGGVPVAIEVADSLQAPLDIVIVRKIPVPREPEAGYGAVTEDGTLVLNEPLAKRLGLEHSQAEIQAEAVRDEIRRRGMLYRRKILPSPVKGRPVIIVDDGLASGYTMLAAIQSLRHRKAAEVSVAVPVASSSAFDLVKPVVNTLVCLMVARTTRFAVADYYQNWYDLDDEDVSRYLEDWRAGHPVLHTIP